MHPDSLPAFFRIQIALANRIIIGADEAGYGPNLGPLLIAATAWAIPQEMSTETFSQCLATVFRAESWTSGCKHLPLGDSKLLYQPSSGLASLEAGLLALLHQIDAPGPLICPTNLAVFERFVRWNARTEAIRIPWYEELEDFPVPQIVPAAEVQRLAQIAKLALQSHAIELIGVRAAIISESEFNAAVQKSGSKGQLLSSTTLQLVSSFCNDESREVEVFCDRQGGRKNYLPILIEAMPDEWFVETKQTASRCSYQNTNQPRREFHFTVGGDSFGPTALASMLAKYLRERFMQSFNHFWRRQLPDLRATAGYPLDAKRFREQIEPAAQKLQLDESLWWRCR